MAWKYSLENTHKYVPREDRKGRMCHQECVKDEPHFLFLCSLYAGICQKYPDLFWDLADGRIFLLISLKSVGCRGDNT